MANFKNIAMAILMVIVAFAFASCEADVFEDGWDNGWNPTPEDPTYELVTEHVNSTSNGMVLLDDHKAILKKDGRVIDEKPYKATHEVSCSKITLKRAVAEQLENKTVAYANGFNLNGTLMTASVELTDCKTVYFSENDRTYCHPQYGVDGAIAKLTCCNPQPTSLELKEISGNILNGFVVVKDHGEEKFPVEINVVDDDVRTVEYSDATLISADKAQITKTVKVNGETIETTPILVDLKASLECGEMITTGDLNQLAYGADAAVADGKAEISMNIVSFTAVVNMPSIVSFVDEGETHTAKVVYNSLYVTSNGKISIEDNSAENIDIMNTAYFKLVCDGFDMASDDKEIRQTKRVYAEFEKEEGNTVYFILHGNEDIRFTAPSGISIVAGADQTKVVEKLGLVANSRTSGNWTANGTQTVNNVKFTSYTRTDSYKYSNGVNNTVTLTKNDSYAVVYNGHEYAVKMPEVNLMAEAPAAGNVVATSNYKEQQYSLVYTVLRNNVSASDETIITLRKEVKKTIDGYTAIAIHVTTAYHAAGQSLVSDGTKIEELFRKDSDHSQYIVRDVDANGAIIKEYSLTNVDESAIISLLTTTEGFKPAYLEREFGNDKKKPQSWGYEQINGNGVFGVNSFMALTVYNADPWIASVYATEDGVIYGNIHIY